MDLFLKACGATGPLTIEIEGPGYDGAERRQFTQPYVVVGRDERADLVLDHDLVSRRHAYFQVLKGHVFLIDLESREGTVLGAAPIESGWVAPGQVVQIGPFALRFAAPETGNAPPDANADSIPTLNPLAAKSPPHDHLPPVALEFQTQSSGHSIWRMTQITALVGRSPRCKVRFLDSDVSKFHCALVRTPRGLWVVDLLGRGGITVNETPTRSAALGPADVLGLGKMLVRANYDAKPGPVGLPQRQTRPRSGLPATQAPASGTLAPARFATDQAPAPAAGDLSLLLNHFGQMQQQMMDQFQQSMMMMMQMFGGMHSEQMTLVREELDRLRELGDEVRSLKTELTARAAAPASAPAAPPPAFWPPAAPPRPSAYPPDTPSAPPRPAPTSAPAPNGDLGGAKKPIPVAALDPTTDVHEWIGRRLASIEEEQQSRWRKVMGLFKGGA